MITARPTELSMIEATYKDDPRMRVRFNWPVFAGTGADSSSVVYGEIEPGDHLGIHRDSSEEVLLILEGTAEATVGDETGRLSAGQLAVVAALVPTVWSTWATESCAISDSSRPRRRLRSSTNLYCQLTNGLSAHPTGCRPAACLRRTTNRG